MVQDKNTTAERELLKTIEGSPALEKKVRSLGVGSFMATFNDKFVVLLQGFKQLSGGGLKKISLKTINMALVGVLLFLFACSGLSVFAGIQQLGNIPRFDISKLKPTTIDGASIELPVKQLEYYVDVVMGRNIFVPFKEEEKPKEAMTNAFHINTLVENLQVVGISWTGGEDGTGERYAMVEDLKAELTYFLSVGDKILQLTVKEIKEESLVLGYEDEEVELR